MWRKVHPIILLATLQLFPLHLHDSKENSGNKIFASGAWKAEATMATGVGQEEHDKELKGTKMTTTMIQATPSLLVDTKYWIKDTEFGERDNWLDGKKPCTLIERIKLSEECVISMADSLDVIGGKALESNIKDLTLAMDGILLLEEETLVDSDDDGLDYAFLRYLNESGDCIDNQDDQSTSDKHLFQFEPNSNQLSWFNAENWVSQLNEDPKLNLLIPDSHRIPCSEDEVVFGDRKFALGPLIDLNERSKTLSFKVNFRANLNEDFNYKKLNVNNVRVSKLKIGSEMYNQKEFEQLINSNQYENILFQFNDNMSTLKSEDGFVYGQNSLLTIDESSVRENSSYCIDEAGCLCGNENTNIMETICSFIQILNDLEQPCYDPLYSIGYCNKLCASIITISIDPVRFSERFVVSIINDIIDQEELNYFGENVFSGGRRTGESKYEITFRHVPNGESYNENYASTKSLGREVEFAKLVFDKLNNEATKSFYGIKTITLRSSIGWKRNDRDAIFWMTFSLFSLLSLLLISVQNRKTNNGIGSLIQAKDWFTRNLLNRGRVCELDETESFLRYNDQLVIEETGSTGHSNGGFPSLEMDEIDLSENEEVEE